MRTFILLTFGFLGFAFYEMSGGADFEPASARLAQAEPLREAPVAAAREPAADVSIAAATITKIDSTSDVTRVALNLTDVSAAAAQPAAPIVTAPVTPARIIDSSQTPQVILPSLIATTPTTSADPATGDIRTVSGNRVNVRGGPSTNYDVVSRLTRGEEVEVLEDNGNGWVRMRPLEGGNVGWMADFLLNEG